MTKLKFLNLCILQWFFIRLTKIVDIETKKIIGYRFLFGVIPATGWGSDYKYIFNRGKK
jgi:hypothetical protein